MIAEIITIALGLSPAAEPSAGAAARGLAALGVQVRPGIATASTRQELQQRIAEALGRSNLVVTVGGLDQPSGYLVKSVIGSGLGLPLVPDARATEALRQYYRRTGESPVAEDAQLAHLPKGSVCLPCFYGKVSGCALSAGQQHIILLPQHPQEIEAIFDRHLRSYLGQPSAAPGGEMVHTINVYGISREDCQKRLGDLLHAANPSLVVETEGNELRVRVRATGAGAAQQASAALKAAATRLGNKAYGVDVPNLQTAVIQKAQKKQMELSIAEAGTRGLLTRLLSETPGGAELLRFCTGVDTAEQKIQKLGLSPKLLKKHGGVSEQAVVAMAAAVRKKQNTKLGVAISAASDPADKKASADTVYIAVCDASSVLVKKLVVSGGRDGVVDAAVSRSLNMIRLFVDAFPKPCAGSVPLADALAGKAAVTAEEDAQAEPELSFGKRLLENFIIRKTDRGVALARKLVFLVAILVFVGSAAYVGRYQLNSQMAKKQALELQNLFAFGEDMEDVEISEDFPSEYLTKFAALYSINPDVVAFINIPETNVQYPIVQAMDNDYYLRRDFYEKNNDHGIPFMDYRVDVEKPSDNLVVYGHNMKDGQIFGELIQYRDLAYFKEHPVIDFSTVYEQAEYRIFSIFITNAYSNQGPVFQYHNFIDAKDDKDFEAFANQVKIRSLIETGVDVRPGDTLLTLSTCTYEFKDARFVVMARKVRDGEDAYEGANSAYMNPQPLMPDIWYKTFGGARPNVSGADWVASSGPVTPAGITASGNGSPRHSSSTASGSSSGGSSSGNSSSGSSSSDQDDLLSSSSGSSSSQSQQAKAKEALKEAEDALRKAERAADKAEQASDLNAAKRALRDAEKAAEDAEKAAIRADETDEYTLADKAWEAYHDAQRAVARAKAAVELLSPSSSSSQPSPSSSLPSSSSSQPSSSSSQPSSSSSEPGSSSSQPSSSSSEPSSSEEPSSSSEPSSSNDSSSSSEEEPDGETGNDSGTPDTVTVQAAGRTITDDALEVVSRIVQQEVGTSFNTEAIKAQAVASYTFVLYNNETNKVPSVAMASTVNSKVKKAVSQVLGEAVYYRNGLAFTPYHSTSAGSTTSSKAVWGGSYPYLVSVDSSVDAEVNSFVATKTLSASSVSKLLKDKLGINTSGYDPEDWFEVLSTVDGGYNGNMRVCGKTKSQLSGATLTGRLLRESVLNLRSACFEVKYKPSSDSFVFTTYGYGHGVGMSQNGANQLAAQGWSYDEILEYYYPGTTVA